MYIPDIDIYRQSGILPYKFVDGNIFLLLITSRKGNRWIIPKGIVEPHLTPVESASQEAFEEAGIEGNISIKSIGQYTHDKWGGTCTITVFPMKVEKEYDDWPEHSIRKRQWFLLDEALNRIDSPVLKDHISEFARGLKRST